MATASPYKFDSNLPQTNRGNCEDDYIEELIQNSLIEIEQNSGLLKNYEALHAQGKLEELDKSYGELSAEYLKKLIDINNSLLERGTNNEPDDEAKKNENCEECSSEQEAVDQPESSADAEREKQQQRISMAKIKYDHLRKEYQHKIVTSLQSKLGAEVDSTEDTMKREIADAFFYYLVRNEEPNHIIIKTIARILNPIPFEHNPTYPWPKVRCEVIGNSTIFAHFYQRLGKSPAALEFLVHQYPQLLFGKASGYLMHALMDHLPYDTIHKIMQIRDENERTHLFTTDGCCGSFYAKQYAGHIDELFELLSLQDKNGQTALHLNRKWIAGMLRCIYTPKYRNQVRHLLGLRDNNNKTAAELTKRDCPALSWLTFQIENNRYILQNDTSVLIIYSTKGRSKAEEEASTIYTAFNSKRDNLHSKYKLKLEKNKTKNQIFELIQQSAGESGENDQFSALIVILMSHGTEGGIEDYRGELIPFKSIEDMMCKENRLKDRPKILITQCCQNRLGTVDDKAAYAPTSPDFCAIMSSMSGEKSKRGVFLGKLAEQVEKCQWNDDIFRIISHVSSELQKDGHPQTPIIMGTLKAGYYPENKWRNLLQIEEPSADE